MWVGHLKRGDEHQHPVGVELLSQLVHCIMTLDSRKNPVSNKVGRRYFFMNLIHDPRRAISLVLNCWEVAFPSSCSIPSTLGKSHFPRVPGSFPRCFSTCTAWIVGIWASPQKTWNLASCLSALQGRIELPLRFSARLDPGVPRHPCVHPPSIFKLFPLFLS